LVSVVLLVAVLPNHHSELGAVVSEAMQLYDELSNL
jgi:hypothetical protein